MNPHKPSTKPPPQPSPAPVVAAVAEPSRCRHHPRCPGCPLMGRDYAEQLQTKHARVRRAFGRFGHLPAPPAPLPAPRQMAYRHRLKLPLHVMNDHVSIGLYDRAGRSSLQRSTLPSSPGLIDGTFSIAHTRRTFLALAQAGSGAPRLELMVYSPPEASAVSARLPLRTLVALTGIAPTGDHALAAWSDDALRVATVRCR